MNEILKSRAAAYGDRYPVTVVTPVHDVDLKLVKKCYDSLRAQTLGFENMEWVVVVHNCKEGYFPRIRELIGERENVQIYELNNECRTPSSPRNYGLNFVHGSYVGFLDADDTYSPDCCEQAASALAENNAQVAMFRMETEADDPSRMAVRQFVFVDQTQPLILLEKGKWDSRNFIYGAALNVTSKMYDMHYLNALPLRFDEGVTVAEDNMFNLTAFGKADRICILPQLIGYRYYLNNGSMVQSFTKTPEEVVRCARGFKKVFDSGLSLGLYMNYVICDLLGFESAISLATSALTREDRMKVKEILGDYLQYIEPIRESKLYTKQMTAIVTKLPRLVIGHPVAATNIVNFLKRLGVDPGAQISKQV